MATLMVKWFSTGQCTRDTRYVLVKLEGTWGVGRTDPNDIWFPFGRRHTVRTTQLLVESKKVKYAWTSHVYVGSSAASSKG